MLRVILLLVGMLIPCVALAAPPQSLDADICAGDGRAGILDDTAQYPKLLIGYAARSPCRVAGVDYAVGVPRTRSLKDPTLPGNLPRGLTYNASQKLVRCDNGDRIVVQDLDFSVRGGVGLYIPSCTNVTIRFNRFKIGANCVGVIMQGRDAQGIIVEYNEIDGGGGSSSDGCPSDRRSEMVTLNAAGGLKQVRYNWLRNAPQHFVSFGGTTGRNSGSIVLKSNLIEKCGYYEGGHCNGFQIVGGQYDRAVIAHNTFVSPQPGASGFPSGLVIPISFMAQLGGNLSNGRIYGNTIVTSRPKKTVSYAIYCGAEPTAGGANVGALVYSNYIDARGAYGAFYPNQPCSGAWSDARPNVDMVTGRFLKRP